MLLTRGMKAYDIAKELNTDHSTISRDIKFLTTQSQDYLNSLAKETLPFMYQTSIEGIRDVIKECWIIYQSEDNSRVNMYQRLYRAARLEKFDERGQKMFEGDNDTITEDELDYYLKAKLRVPPEQRYQDKREEWFSHESSWYWRGANGYDGRGCNQFTGCVLECRFYPGYGRIDDEEVIAEHNKVVESYRQRNAVVEPPTESELLRLAKMHRFPLD